MNKKVLNMFVITILYLIISGSNIYAAIPPERPDNFRANYPVYNFSTKENSIALNWNASLNADFYILEVQTQTNWANQSLSEAIEVSGTSYTDVRQNTISSPTSGTIFVYKLYAATYDRDEFGDIIIDQYAISTSYSSLAVLTDPAVSAQSLSTSEVKLTWDDVQFDNNSIDYELQFYKSGIRVGQEQINASDIGNSVPRVNGKVEYTITDLDKSTEYQFRLVSKIDAEDLRKNPYVQILGATSISAYLQKYNETIVKLIWDEYTGSIPASDLYYKVIEISEKSGQKTNKVIATPQVPYYFIQLKDETEYSYIVEVLKKTDDSKVAQSEEVSLTEIIIPATPKTPLLSHSVTNTSIEILWNVPQNINGQIDTQTRYDVWMFENPNYIDNVRKFYTPDNENVVDNRIAEDLNLDADDDNFSMIKINNIDVYRYYMNNLAPNTEYYVAVVAKNNYLLQDPDNPDMLINKMYNSEPAMLSLKTSTDSIDQPVALVNPEGVAIKVDNQGRTLVTSNSVTICWPLGTDEGGTFESYYDDEVYFKVGYELYSSNFNRNLTNNPNNPNYNVHESNVTIIREAEEATAQITGLNTNTLYVFWVKAYRDVSGETVITKVSEVSDLVIAATLPDYQDPEVTPTVPVISVIDDEYQDSIIVQFNSLAGMEYTITWNTEDKVGSSKSQLSYIALTTMTPDSVTITGLDPETIYYFRIRATNDGINSEWSDSVVGITTPILPPDPPRGFGVKNIVKDGQKTSDIEEHYINLQWDMENNIRYIIEVSRNDDFSDSEIIEVDSSSEYKLENLKGGPLTSNTRYWIRIFAVDTESEKVSQSSLYLTIKTKKNYDEYDSYVDKDEDIDDEDEDEDDEDEDKIKIKEIIDGKKGTWSYDLTGTIAEKEMQKIKSDNMLDYKINLSTTSVSGINKREIILPYKVIQMLSQSDENLIIMGDNAEFIFLPKFLELDKLNLKQDFGQEVKVNITISNINSNTFETTDNIKTLSKVYEVNVKVIGNEEKQVIELNSPIKLIIKLNKNNQLGTIYPYYLYPGSSRWQKLADAEYSIINDELILFYDNTGRFLGNKQLADFKGLETYKYNTEIAELLSSNMIKSIDSDDIKPSEDITLEQAVKILLDIVNQENNNNYMEIAKKAGLLENLKNTKSTRAITREEAADMLMKMFEIKTGQELTKVSISNYNDANEIEENYLISVSNAINMQLLIPSGKQIMPKANMSRGEMLLAIKKMNDIIKLY